MPNDHSRETEDPKDRNRAASADTQREYESPTLVAEENGIYSASLAVDSRLSGRANRAVRAASMQQMQQTHGNRAVQRFVQRTVSVQRDPSSGPRLNLLPPSLEMPLGPLNTTLSPGGLELGYRRGGVRAGAEYGWGGPLDLNLGYGAPLMPWMMDVEPSLTAGATGINGLMNGRPAGALGAIGGMAGTLGDIAGSGEPSPYRWGVGLQGSIGPDEQRIMAGLRLDF